jgi:hypothetical protein
MWQPYLTNRLPEDDEYWKVVREIKNSGMKTLRIISGKYVFL